MKLTPYEGWERTDPETLQLAEAVINVRVDVGRSFRMIADHWEESLSRIERYGKNKEVSLMIDTLSAEVEEDKRALEELRHAIHGKLLGELDCAALVASSQDADYCTDVLLALVMNENERMANLLGFDAEIEKVRIQDAFRILLKQVGLAEW